MKFTQLCTDIGNIYTYVYIKMEFTKTDSIFSALDIHVLYIIPTDNTF